MKRITFLCFLIGLFAAPAFAQQSINLQCTPVKFTITSSKTDDPLKPYKGGEVHTVVIGGGVAKVTTYKNGLVSGQPTVLGNVQKFNEKGTQSYMWTKDDGSMKTTFEYSSNNVFSYMIINMKADVALQQVGFCKPI